MCRPKQERSRAHVTLVALLCCLLKLGPPVRRAAFFRGGSVIAPRARGGCAHATANPTRSGAKASPTGTGRTDDPDGAAPGVGQAAAGLRRPAKANENN